MESVPNRCTEVSDKLRRELKVVASSELSERDRHLMIDILSMRCALLYDLISGPTQAAKVATGFLRTVKGLKTLDVGKYAEDWKIIREVITSADFLSRYPDSVACRSEFKQQAGGRIHYKWIETSALGLMEGEGWFERLNQWAVFDSKANLTSLDLTTESCTDYLSFEANYPEITLSKREIRVIKRVARDFVGDFNLIDFPFRPRHGNGATKELVRSKADRWHKNRHFSVDSDLKVYLQWRLSDRNWKAALFCPYNGLDRTCIVVCVPKSMTKNRTISKEPTTLQFLQQDIFQALDDWFTSHPALGISLHDQEASRSLALRGSADGSYATIDLSNASDSVSVALVELMFDDLPILYPLLATRSTRALVMSNDNTVSEVIELRKFAPMGSATCFPVESLVFSILVESAIRLKTGRASTGNEPFRVYGDDIVVRTEYADAVIDLLVKAGFTVNASKSFSTIIQHNFREACGIEALDGNDVTPLRLSRRLQTLQTKQADHQAGLGVGQIDMVNRSYLYGYWNLRRWLNDILVGHFWYRAALRLSHDDYKFLCRQILDSKPTPLGLASPYVICDTSTDTQWRAYGRKFFPTMQCIAYSVAIATTRQPDQHHDANDLYSWHVSSVANPAPGEKPDVIGLVTIRSRDLKWSKHWVLKS